MKWEVPVPEPVWSNVTPDSVITHENMHAQTIDSFNTKRNLQRKLKPNMTQINQPMTDGGVANSALLIGFHNWVMLGFSLRCN